MEWLSQNWFQVLTCVGIALSWAVHYGISKARWAVMEDKVDELEDKLDEAVEKFGIHQTNPDIHVNPILLKLFDERFDYLKKEQSDTRTDISRIEQLLSK